MSFVREPHNSGGYDIPGLNGPLGLLCLLNPRVYLTQDDSKSFATNIFLSFNLAFLQKALTRLRDMASSMSEHTWTSGDFEHPNEELRWSISVGLVFAFLLSTVAVGLRFLARRVAGGRLYLDDWLMLVALVSVKFRE
jgi:hypothetical protein